MALNSNFVYLCVWWYPCERMFQSDTRNLQCLPYFLKLEDNFANQTSDSKSDDLMLQANSAPLANVDYKVT